jgi:predicted dehydrogenase
VTVWVVGAGAAGEAHVRALLALGIRPLLVGRSAERVEELAHRLGVDGVAGGVEAVPADAPEAAVVAVGHRELAPVSLHLLDRGCRRLLVEKPGALHRADLERVAATAKAGDAAVFVALNRRFYRSVAAAAEAIEEDGGPLSCSFDFTEVEERVLAAISDPGVLARWGIVNSMHVIDLFVHLAGLPARCEHRREGALPWHPSGAVFAGSGITDRGALFAYLATWSGSGRWGVELTTSRRKLVLRPLEELHVQSRGSFALEQVALPAQPPGLKEGFLGQARAFLHGDGDARLCRLDEALTEYALVETMLGYA